jgi:hypothetical protein
LLNPSTKLKAFVWKRIVLDHIKSNGQVAKSDLSGPDPKWKGKEVIWKTIEENELIDL